MPARLPGRLSLRRPRRGPGLAQGVEHLQAHAASRWQRYYDARNLYLLLSKHAATHRHGRRPLHSLWEYLKYTYHRYALEREAGREDAADAVLQGLYDALARSIRPLSRRAALGGVPAASL